MTDDEFVSIEIELGRLASQLNVVEIVQNEIYRRRSLVDEDELQLRPKERAIEKAKAIERAMSLIDVGTFRKALRIINEASEPTDVESGSNADSQRYAELRSDINNVCIVEISSADKDSGRQIFDLDELPDLSESRELLTLLIKQLEES
jgi:hypothetical protein